MAIVKCIECGMNISDKAIACPHCGCPINGKVKVEKYKFKSAKLIIGIISTVLFVIITLQSCAIGIGNELIKNNEISGSVGFLLSLFILVGGIITVVNQNKQSKSSYIIPALIYIIGGFMAFMGIGSYLDLAIWSGISIFFGVLLLAFCGISNS